MFSFNYSLHILGFFPSILPYKTLGKRKIVKTSRDPKVNQVNQYWEGSLRWETMCYTKPSLTESFGHKVLQVKMWTGHNPTSLASFPLECLYQASTSNISLRLLGKNLRQDSHLPSPSHHAQNDNHLRMLIECYNYRLCIIGILH